MDKKAKITVKTVRTNALETICAILEEPRWQSGEHENKVATKITAFKDGKQDHSTL